MKRIYLFILISFFLFPSFTYAKYILQPEFLHIGIEQGLSNGSITCMAQDSLGFIWIGTKHGMNRYDGVDFKLYSSEQNNLPADDISVIHIDRKNRFWIGTIGEGLFLYNPINDSFEKILLDKGSSDKFRYTEIHALLEGENDLLWLATEVGLYSYNPTTQEAKRYRQKKNKLNESEKNDIRAMAMTADKRLWLGTFGSGLSVFDTKNKQYGDIDKLKFSGLTCNTDHVSALFADENNYLLIGTNENGLKQIDFQKKKITNYLSNTIYNGHTIILCIWQDKQGDLWVGTDGKGILHIKKPWTQSPAIQNYQSNPKMPNSLSSNTINAFFQDRQLNQWVGTAKRGVNLIKKIPDGVEYYYSDGKGENKLPVLSIFKDKKGLWLGTDGKGLTLFNDKDKKTTFFNQTSSNGYVGDFVQCIKSATNGNFWIGTYDRGLYHFDTHTHKISNFNRIPGFKCSLPHNDVRDFIVLPSGDLWIATWGGGLAFLNSKTQTTKIYRNEPGNKNSLGNNNVLSLHLDEQGRLWLATYGGGVSLFNPVTGKFKNFKTENSPGLISNFIFSLLPEDKHTLWIGTKEGLCRLNLNTFKFETISINASYASKTVTSLLKDRKGDIWAGTKKGILRVQKGTKRVEFLPGIYDSFSTNSAFIDDIGKLYFGGAECVIAFFPEKINFNAYKLTVCLTDFLLFNKPVPIGSQNTLKHQICYEKKITLKQNQSVITIKYATLDFPFSENINYEVRLKGLEEKWRNVGNQNTATFTNLSPGKYTFNVRPVNDLFTHDEATLAQIDIYVLPPFWLTWWAYLIYAGCLTVIFYLIRKYTLNWIRIRNELKLEKVKHEQDERMHEMKQRFFINISHDIRTPLTLIAGSVNKLCNRGNVQLTEQKSLVTIKANTNRLLNLTEELLNYRKLETGNVTLQVSYEDLVNFVQGIYICYSQFAMNKDIEYEFTHSHPTIYAWIDKKQLEKAICNVIFNAFKFTPEGKKINVDVSIDSIDQLTISVIDTGKGIAVDKIEHIFDRFYQAEKNTQDTGFGIGLSITREIIQLHGGQIYVQSEPEQGSAFSIILQSGKEHFMNAEFIDSSSKEILLSEHFSCDESNESQEFIPEVTEKECSVLIVEDNKEIRDYLSEFLSSHYQIYIASNGQEALDTTIELIPDLVVSDIMMPIMDGITFCHKLKNDMRISHIPVILLTARTLADSVIEGFETGADDYITKPFNERILLARINNILQNRREIRKRVCQEMILNPQEAVFNSQEIILNPQDGVFLSKIVAYIETHIEEPDFNIIQMATEMAMSHSNLYKKIKALTGLTAIGFVKDFRLKKAAQLLSQNEHHITEIAYMVGYSERRHFSQDFKKMFHLTPKEYIEKQKTKTNLESN